MQERGPALTNSILFTPNMRALILKTYLTRNQKMHNFICSLDNIPKPNNSYGVIINTQVLEHVAEPQKVITEFYRILKPKGKLFLTAPQGWGIHGEP